MLHLSTSTNHQGYHFALQKSWQLEGKHRPPAKSSLSEIRDKVSYRFFEDIWQEDLNRFKRKTYRGFNVYAIDGDDLNLPVSQDILDNGFRGYKFSKGYETHYPKMLVTHAFDVMNGLVCRFSYGKKSVCEREHAYKLAPTFESNSITIYDRLHCSYPLFQAHLDAANYFLVRAITNGKTAPKPVKRFMNSNRTDTVVEWYPAHKEGRVEPLRLRLVKIKHPKTNSIAVFATNLPEDVFTRAEIGKLYRKRWEIEGSFRDLTSTLKMNQLHSTKLNGILQEIYCLLWLVNAVKMQMNQMGDRSDDLLADKYTRSNFKLCAELVIDNLDLLISVRKRRRLLNLLRYWILKTREQRRHLSRNYPRSVKFYGKKYYRSTKVKRRPA